MVGAGVVICLEQGADLHMAQQMPLPLTVSCFGKIQTGVTFLVPAHPGSPRQRAIKCVCVYGIIIALVFAEFKSSCGSRGWWSYFANFIYTALKVFSKGKETEGMGKRLKWMT